MKVLTTPRPAAPASIEVQISGGRKCHVLPLGFDDLIMAGDGLRKACQFELPTSADQTVLREQVLSAITSGNLQVMFGPYVEYVVFGLAHAAVDVELETPIPECTVDLTPDEWLAFAKSIQRELKSRTGRATYSGTDVTAIAKAASTRGKQDEEAEKNG